MAKNKFQTAVKRAASGIKKNTASQNRETNSKSRVKTGESAKKAEITYLPVSGFRVTSPFGEDRGDHVHSGIDLAVPQGTPVSAVKGGTVSFAGSAGGYGYRVIISHPDGTQTTYNHLSDIGVSEGDTVRAGAQIALSGNTGYSSGPHLHFEVKDTSGTYVNPQSYYDFGTGIAAAADGSYASKLSAAKSGGTGKGKSGSSKAKARGAVTADLPMDEASLPDAPALKSFNTKKYAPKDFFQSDSPVTLLMPNLNITAKRTKTTKRASL